MGLMYLVQHSVTFYPTADIFHLPKPDKYMAPVNKNMTIQETSSEPNNYRYGILIDQMRH